VPRGLRLPDPRLRRAAVEWARQLLEQEQVRLPRNPRTRDLLVLLVVVWATGVLGYVVFTVVSGRPEDVNWVTAAAWAAVIAWGVRRRRALRRTIELNDDPAPDGG
jgi:hypothetical protein